MSKFDNKERRRYYGHRIGDQVSLGFNHKWEVGIVEKYDLTDNNCIYVKIDSGEVIKCVAEWCKTIKKVDE